LLREAIRIGNRRWSAAVKRGKSIDWKDDREATAFIGSIVRYAGLLAKVGYAEEAQEASRTALALDPENQHARRLLELTVTQIEFRRALMEDEKRGTTTAHATSLGVACGQPD
jgi:hypothetical protein